MITRIERLLRYIEKLTKKDTFTKAHIMNEFEISSATFQRDISMLRNKVGIDICFDHFDDCYRIHKSELTIVSTHFLKTVKGQGFYLNDMEVQLILDSFHDIALVDKPEKLKSLMYRMEGAINFKDKHDS